MTSAAENARKLRQQRSGSSSSSKKATTEKKTVTKKKPSILDRALAPAKVLIDVSTDASKGVGRGLMTVADYTGRPIKAAINSGVNALPKGVQEANVLSLGEKSQKSIQGGLDLGPVRLGGKNKEKFVSNKIGFTEAITKGIDFDQITKQSPGARQNERNGKPGKILQYTTNALGEVASDVTNFVPGVGIGTTAAKGTKGAMTGLGKTEIAARLAGGGFADEAELVLKGARHEVSNEALEAVGLKRGLQVKGIGSVGGKKTKAVVQAAERVRPGRATSAVSSAITDTKVGDNLATKFERVGGARDIEKSRGKVARMNYERSVQRSVHESEAAKIKFRRDVADTMTGAEKKAVRKYDQVVLRDALEGGAEALAKATADLGEETFGKLRSAFDEGYKRLNDNVGGKLPYTENYYRRILSDDAVEAMKRDPRIKERVEQYLNIRPGKISATMRRKKAGDEFMGEILETGSSSEINKIFRAKTGNNFDLLGADIQKSLDSVASQISGATKNRVLGQKLVDSGLADLEGYVPLPKNVKKRAALADEMQLAADRRDLAQAQADELKGIKSPINKAKSKMPTAIEADNPQLARQFGLPSGGVNNPAAMFDARALGKEGVDLYHGTAQPFDEFADKAIDTSLRGAMRSGFDPNTEASFYFSDKAKVASDFAEQNKGYAELSIEPSVARGEVRLGTEQGYDFFEASPDGTSFRRVSPEEALAMEDPSHLVALPPNKAPRVIKSNVRGPILDLTDPSNIPEDLYQRLKDEGRFNPRQTLDNNTRFMGEDWGTPGYQGHEASSALVRWLRDNGYGGAKVQDTKLAGKQSFLVRKAAIRGVPGDVAEMDNISKAFSPAVDPVVQRKELLAQVTASKRQFRTANQMYKALKPQELKSVLDDTLKKYGAMEVNGLDLLAQADVRAALDKMNTLASKVNETGALLKSFDRLTGVWKAQQLLTPGFHIRNFFGGMFNNWLAGVDSDQYFIFLRNYKRYVAGGADAVPNPTIRAALVEAERMGVIRAGDANLYLADHLDDLATKGSAFNPLSQNFGPYKANRQVGNAVEDQLRGTLFLDTYLKNGGNAEEAFFRTFRFHYDNQNLSAFEKTYMRRLVPFFSFTRNNLPLQIEMLAQQPGKYLAYANAQRGALSSTEYDSERPDFLSDFTIRTPFDLNGSPAYATPDLMYRDLDVLKAEGPLYALRNTHPLFQQALQALTDKQIGRDYPLSRMTPKEADGATGAIARALGLVNEDGEIPRGTYETLRRAIPLLKYDKIHDSNDNRAMEAISSLLLGMGLRIDDGLDAGTEPVAPTRSQRGATPARPAASTRRPSGGSSSSNSLAETARRLRALRSAS